MSATELFESTGDIYLSLIHPNNQELPASAHFVSLLKLADATSERLVKELTRAQIGGSGSSDS